jgi:hypothetical protein
MTVTLYWVTFFVFVLNIPFGYWRINVKKFSLQWVLAIHIPIPFIISLRLLTPIGFAWYTYIFLVAAFILGQKSGSLLHAYMKQSCSQASSCLVMDLYKCSGL